MAIDNVHELDHLLKASTNRHLKVYNGTNAMDERIHEWMETPQGTMADNPGWGNNLGKYKFEPPSVDLAVAVEMAIVRKLPQDIELLDIRGIKVSFPEIDRMDVTVLSQIGLFNSSVKMGVE